MQGIHQAASGLFRQVHLGHIARHYHFAAHAHAGQEHLHLFGGGVLGFIQDDKGIVQRAAAHIGQRGHLNGLLFYQLLEGFRPQQVKQAVIQRAQIGVHLILQIAGQKAQLLPRFHGGAGQNNAADVF